MKHWLVATYKPNEVKRLKLNLSNPKFIIKKKQEYDKLNSYIND